MSDDKEARHAREVVRDREKAVWNAVENVGRDLRSSPAAREVAAQIAPTTTTEAEAPRKKAVESQSA